MKSDKGVTTSSVIIYVIAMMIVIGIIATITSFFYTNVMNTKDNSDNISEMTKFNMYFLEEVKNENNSIINISDTSILFKTGNMFTFMDNSIYFNKIKICENVKEMKFSEEDINNKKIIKVLIVSGDIMEYTKNVSYVMTGDSM